MVSEKVWRLVSSKSDHLYTFTLSRNVLIIENRILFNSIRAAVEFDDKPVSLYPVQLQSLLSRYFKQS